MAREAENSKRIFIARALSEIMHTALKEDPCISGECSKASGEQELVAGFAWALRNAGKLYPYIAADWPMSIKADDLYLLAGRMVFVELPAHHTASPHPLSLRLLGGASGEMGIIYLT